MLFAHDAITTLMDPVMQCGFAGFALTLLGFLFWGVKRLLSAFENNGRVVEANTKMMETINDTLSRHDTGAVTRHRESQTAIHDMREKLIAKLAANGIEP